MLYDRNQHKIVKIKKKKEITGIFLVLQWLRLCFPMQREWV